MTSTFVLGKGNFRMFVVVGYSLALINLLIVIMMTADSIKFYLDFHAFICVVGGTAFSILIGFSPSGLKRLYNIYRVSIKNKDVDTNLLIRDIVRVAKETRGEINQTYLATFKSNHPFFKDGLQLISDGFSAEQIQNILDERISAAEERYKDDERFMKALVKIPPSFGLIGTTVGLVALFAQVGSADALKKIGPAMAVAMTATLYGLIVAFAVLSPLVDRLGEISLNNVRIRELIMKGIVHLKAKNSPIFIEEVLKSYLTFASQNTFKK